MRKFRGSSSVSPRVRFRLLPIRVFLVGGIVLGGAAGALAVGRASSPIADAASPASTTTTTQGPTRVLVLGDSNLEWSNEIVTAAFDDSGLMVTTHGKAGYGLKDLDSYWLAQLPGLLAESDPDVVIVALGTNDTAPEDSSTFAARLDRLMEAMGDRRVIWVTHSELRAEPQASGAKIVNEAIRAARGRYSNLSVLDLAPLEVMNSHLFGEDLVHFNDTGRAVLGHELVQATQQVASSPVNVPVPITVPVTVPPVTIPPVTVPALP